MSVHNVNIYKLSKVLIKEGPEVIILLDKTYKDLVQYRGWAAVRQIMREIEHTKDLMKSHLENATNIKKLKGKVNG